MISENKFLELSKKVQNLGFSQSLVEISGIAINGMPIDRITVWKFIDNKTSMICESKWDKDGGEVKPSFIFDCVRFPTYFKGLNSENIIVANDVYNNIYTFELVEHFKENNICSALHIPVFVDGHLYGAVFFSTVNKFHFWNNDDIKFGSDVSQIISIAYISSKRNDDLMKINAYAEHIKIFNEELQEVIKKKNEKFIEYEFINSHLLNAPLSRLKGLMNVLVYEMDHDNRKNEVDFIVTKIYEEYDEMDKVITKISVLINKGEDIDRDDLD